MDQKQEVQDEQYKYPYHYIPSWRREGFSQTKHWSWGFRYLGGLKVVLDQLQNYSFNSLIDIGCGEGRFLQEVCFEYPSLRTLGVDYSERAIRLARAMNPDLRYEVKNIIDAPLDEEFQAAVLIEVLEHIPPPRINAFVEGVRHTLKEDGVLVLTVPHENVSLADKHYQHFSSESLKEVLSDHFDTIKFIPFDAAPKRMGLLERMPRSIMRRVIGGEGKNFVITNKWINSIFFSIYIKKYLYGIKEAKCSRMCVVAKVS